jgi:hypothetical protein
VEISFTCMNARSGSKDGGGRARCQIRQRVRFAAGSGWSEVRILTGWVEMTKAFFRSYSNAEI